MGQAAMGKRNIPAQHLSQNTRIFAVRLALAVVCAALLTGALAGAFHFLPASWPLSPSRMAPGWAVPLMLAAAACCALAIYLFQQPFFKRAAETIHDSRLASYGDTVLTPLVTPRAFDPLYGSLGDEETRPLAWCAPKSRARHAAFTALVDFAQTGDGHPARGGLLRFSFIQVTGPAGSGKTRLAMEAARSLSGLENWDGLPPWNKRRRAARGPGWDAGWLAMPVFAGDAAGGPVPLPSASSNRHDEQRLRPWLARLGAWRPRRPAVLILDDPQPGVAWAAVNALHTAASSEHLPYRHPVRLIIVSARRPAAS